MRSLWVIRGERGHAGGRWLFLREKCPCSAHLMLSSTFLSLLMHHSPNRSLLTQPLTHSLVRSLTHSRTHSTIQPLNLPFQRLTPVPLFSSFTHALTETRPTYALMSHVLTYSLIHSVTTLSLTALFTCRILCCRTAIGQHFDTLCKAQRTRHSDCK